MFGIFDRKKRERQFLELLKAAQEGDMIDRGLQRLRQIAVEHNLHLMKDDETSLATAVVAFVAGQVIERTGIDSSRIKDDGQFAAMIIIFSGADYLSRITKTKFEIVSSLATVTAFPDTSPNELAALIREFADEYNRMATDPEDSKILTAVRSRMAAWVNDACSEHLDVLADILSITIRAVR